MSETITTTANTLGSTNFIFTKERLCKNCKFWDTLATKVIHIEWGVCRNDLVAEKTSSTFSLDTRGDFGCVDFQEILTVSGLG